jgi:PAS domain S-box-containing protein
MNERDHSAVRPAVSSMRSHTLADESHDTLLAITPEGVIVACNRAADVLRGHSREQAAGAQLQELLGYSDQPRREAWAAALARAPEVDTWAFETNFTVVVDSTRQSNQRAL